MKKHTVYIAILLLLFLVLLFIPLIADNKEKTILFPPAIPITNIGTSLPYMAKGEKLKFKVTYLGVTGGYATMEVDVPQVETDKDKIIFTLKAWTTPFVSHMYKLDMELLSISTRENYHNIYYMEDRFEKKRLYYHTLDFDYTKGDYDYVRKRKKSIKTNTYAIKGEGFNVVSSFYILRTLDLVPGRHYMAKIYYKNKIYDTSIYVGNRDTIRTEFGKIRTIKVVPKMKFKGLIFNTGDIIIYLSDDKYRIPVLMKSKLAIGSFKCKLIEGYPVKKK